MSTVIDTMIFYNSGVTGQSINLILYAANLQAYNTGLAGLDILTSVNWSEHLIPMAESASLGFYYVDLTVSAVLPANTIFSGYLYQGSSPSTPVAAVGIFRWTGTQIVQLETSLTAESLPAAPPGGNGGLPTVNAGNQVAGLAAPITLPANAPATFLANDTSIMRLLGLVGDNQGVRNQIYDSNGNLVSADLCHYSTGAQATANDGVTGLINKWTLSNTYLAGALTNQVLPRIVG